MNESTYIPPTVVQAIADLCGALKHCKQAGNIEWVAKHSDKLRRIERDFLPHGSGFDSGTFVNKSRSNDSVVTLVTSFHHMDENGSYDGWTDHIIIVRPAFRGVDIHITGSDRNSWKGYAHGIFDTALNHEFTREEWLLIQEQRI